MGISGGGKKRRADETAKQREIGDRIRLVREEKLGVTQETLGQRLGVSHATVSYWERGGNALPANLRRLAEVAGVTMEFLTNGSDAAADPRLRQLTNRLMALNEDEFAAYVENFNSQLDLREMLIARRLNSKIKS